MSSCEYKSCSPTRTEERDEPNEHMGWSNATIKDDQPHLSRWRCRGKHNGRNDEIVEAVDFGRKKSLKQSFLGCFLVAPPNKKSGDEGENIQSKQFAEKLPILSGPTEDNGVEDKMPEIPELASFIREEDGWTDNLSVVGMHEWSPGSSVSLQLVAFPEDYRKKDVKPDQEDRLDAFRPTVFSPEDLKNNVFRHNHTENGSIKDHPQKTEAARGCGKHNSTTSTTDLSSLFAEVTFEEDSFEVDSLTTSSWKEEPDASSWKEEIEETLSAFEAVHDASTEEESFQGVDLTNMLDEDAEQVQDATEIDFSEAAKEPVDVVNVTQAWGFDGFQLVITHLSGDDGD